MKYLNILTASAGLAIAVPTLNPKQTEIDETNKICKSREMDERQCNDYKWFCQEAGNKEPHQLKECLRNTRIFCVDDDQCGHGLKCTRDIAPYALLEPGKCYRKKEQSQAVKRESASPAKDQTQAGEQDSASRPTEVQAELDRICETLGFDWTKCATKRLICIAENDLSQDCIKFAGEDCVNDGQCGPGFKCEVRDFAKRKICYPKDKKTQAGKQEPASPTKEPTQEPTQDTTTNITTPTKDQTQDKKQESASPEINETDKICKTREFSKYSCAHHQQYCRKAGNVELDQLNNCLKVVIKPCKNDNECGHGLQCASPTLNPNYLSICLDKNQLTETGKQESASPANEPTQAGEQESASTTKEPTQAGEQESASSEQTQDKKQDSTSPEIDETDKICKTRNLYKHQCEEYKLVCQSFAGIVEPKQLNYCVKVLGMPCEHDDQCGGGGKQERVEGFECKSSFTPFKPGSCSPKRKQSQAGKQESASPAKEQTQDTTINVATPSRPCTKKPINSSEKSPVVGVKSTQA
ncbi:hypothetical protein E5D57_003104 [Metarhizium anisopliae]|nr:hypothetical protein E5D57_003104 [Metarhizium anisopliae]